jgi:hypothetical protein
LKVRIKRKKGMALINVTRPVHIITYWHREFDRDATVWEIARMKKEGKYKILGGKETFDFRA